MGAQKKKQSRPNYDSEAHDDEGPVHKVHLSAYSIGRYPVTVAEYLEFILHKGYELDRYWTADCFGQFTEPDEWDEQQRHPNRPVVGVSWYEAAAYAAWANCRLPTEAEWERAARGGDGDGRKYPWGNEAPDDTRMNFAPDWKPSVGHPTPVGVYPRGLSPEGLADMAGNVWEWCSDWGGEYDAKEVRDPTGPPKGVGRVVRGGSWVNLPSYCRVSSRDVDHPARRNQSFGFRVVFVLVGQDSSRKS